MTKYPYPFNGTFSISSGFGPRGKSQHNGVDFRVPQGTPIYAVASGRIERTTYDQHGGAYIDIKHDDGNFSRYLHLSAFHVRRGQHVYAGNKIGLSGGAKGTHGAGLSTGPHLHFEIHKGKLNNQVNPLPYLTKNSSQQIKPQISTPAFDFSLYHNNKGLWLKILAGDWGGEISIVRDNQPITGVKIYTKMGRGDRRIVTPPLRNTPYTVSIGGKSIVYSHHIQVIKPPKPEPVPTPLPPVIEPKPEPPKVEVEDKPDLIVEETPIENLTTNNQNMSEDTINNNDEQVFNRELESIKQENRELRELLNNTQKSFDIGTYIVGMAKYGTIDQYIGEAITIIGVILPMLFPELSNTEYFVGILLPGLGGLLTSYLKGQKQVQEAKK